MRETRRICKQCSVEGIGRQLGDVAAMRRAASRVRLRHSQTISNPFPEPEPHSKLGNPFAVPAELNARLVETPSGAPWSAKTVTGSPPA